jgi:CRP-like cAMP-binding protein
MIDSQPALPTTVTSKFLAGLDQAAVADILAAAKIREVAAKHIIFSAGEPAAHLFLLRKGQARYYMVTKPVTRPCLSGCFWET